MSWRNQSNRRRTPLIVLTVSDSSMLGKPLDGGGGTWAASSALRIVEELRADPARASLNSPDAPWYRFMGSLTGTASDNLLFHESGNANSNCKTGSTAEDVLNGTNGMPTLATAYANMLPIVPTHLILEEGGNDLSSSGGGLGRSVSTVVATITSLVAASKAASPTTKVIVVPPHSLGPAALQYQDFEDIQAALTTVATGADYVVNLSGFNTNHMYGGGDPHPSVMNNASLIGTWRTTLDSSNFGCVFYGMRIWNILYAGYKQPLLPGEIWP